MTERADQVASGLRAVQERITRAAEGAGRDPASVTLTVVTKFFPASDLRVLADLGVRHVGENRHQEAEAKAVEVAELDLDWHFIGRLQSNKAAAVAGYATVVESLDRHKLVSALGRGRHRRDATSSRLDVLVQVSLDPPGSRARGGADPLDVTSLADAVSAEPTLRLRGVMAVAPWGEDPAPAFARLGEVAARLRASYPDADWVSAGMSADLEQAVAAGATHVRVGSAVLGPRPAIK